jgi:hypothetical protein
VAKMAERAVVTSASSDDLSWHWHDNLIYGLKLHIGDHERQEWHSDLISTSISSLNGCASRQASFSFGSRPPRSSSTKLVICRLLSITATVADAMA